MTEQEAINEIRNRECIECIGNEIECGSCFYKMAIKALEEVQEYRAIGTVEECRENKEFLDFLYNRINPNDMEQYLSMYNCSDEKIN